MDEILTAEEQNDAALLELLNCKECGETGTSIDIAGQYGPGKCLVLSCPRRRSNDKCNYWYVCCICKQRVDRRHPKDHFKSNKHHKNYKKRFQHGKTTIEDEHNDRTNDNDNNYIHENLSYTFYDTTMDDNDDQTQQVSMDLDNDTIPPSLREVENFPDYDEDDTTGVKETTSNGSSWLEEFFKDLPEPTLAEVMLCFPGQRNMKLFFVAEFVKKHGGVQYLVTRSFRKTCYLTGVVGPDVAGEEEAKLHFESAVQFPSHGKTERKRQALINKIHADHTIQDSLYQATRNLTYKELNRFYGNSNKHSLWNILPAPDVINIDGIACTNPVHLIRFLLAFNTEVEQFTIDFSEEDPDEPGETRYVERVVTIPDSKACRDWKSSLLNQNEATNGGLAERHPKSGGKAILMWKTDWKDGFGGNRSKLQRKGSDGWTNSFSTPADRINSIDNTVLMAIGSMARL